MRNVLFGVALLVALGCGACSSTVLVSKDGKGYYLGNGTNAAYSFFCESGDLLKILEGAQLSQDLRDSLYRTNCGADRSREGVKQVFAAMKPEQRKELRKSFRRNGYDINYLPC
jgi:hypothetical protein